MAYWPYGIGNATKFLENCVFYSDTFSLLFHYTYFEEKMSIYNIENCISLDFGEACEEDIFEVQRRLYFWTFELIELTHIEVMQSALSFYLKYHLKNMIARTLVTDAFAKLIPVICHTDFSEASLEILNFFCIPNLLRIECAIAVRQYFREKPWNEYSHNFGKEFRCKTYLSSKGLYYFLYPFFCTNNNREFLAQLEIPETFDITAPSLSTTSPDHKSFDTPENFDCLRCYHSLENSDKLRAILSRLKILNASETILSSVEKFQPSQTYNEIIELCKSQQNFEPFIEIIQEKAASCIDVDLFYYLYLSFKKRPYAYDKILFMLENDLSLPVILERDNILVEDIDI